MTAATLARPPIPVVVHQHVEESAMLRHVRAVLVRAPHVRLHQLARLDERIAAHLDGVAVAGDYGRRCLHAALERPGAGEVFAVAVRAIEERDDASLDRLLALEAALPAARRGLLSALGWVSAQQLQGIARRLLGSDNPRHRAIGIAACRMHHADPGALLAAALRDPDAHLRAGALRAVGELGRVDLLEHVRAAVADDDAGAVYWAAWSACLLGDRDAALKVLAFVAQQRDGDAGYRALALALQAMDIEAGRELMRTLSKAAQAEPGALSRRRRLLRACGLLGDAQFVPWLLEQMADLRVARLAGEAFSLITGVDLARQDLETKPPEQPVAGPSENPADDDVALDEDESLPWPDADKLRGWWRAHAGEFPAGRRTFMGVPPGADPSLRVLRDGQQRQRILAAQWLSLLVPGTALFNTAAPAPRQQRRLAGQR